MAILLVWYGFVSHENSTYHLSTC